MKFKANPPQSIINVKKCNFPNSVLEGWYGTKTTG